MVEQWPPREVDHWRTIYGARFLEIETTSVEHASGLNCRRLKPPDCFLLSVPRRALWVSLVVGGLPPAAESAMERPCNHLKCAA